MNVTRRRSHAERQRRLRQRQRSGEVVAPVNVGLHLVEALIDLRWLDEDMSEDRAAIGRAIGAMLSDMANARRKA